MEEKLSETGNPLIDVETNIEIILGAPPPPPPPLLNTVNVVMLRRLYTFCRLD